MWFLPGDQASRLVQGVLGDWQWSAVITAQTGSPYTVTAGKDQSQSGLGQGRGVKIGPACGSGACGNRAPCVDWLNRNSFALPQAGTFGTMGKGSVVGASLFIWDMGIFKNFATDERWKLQFRAEFFNAFNLANFISPSASFSGEALGSI